MEGMNGPDLLEKENCEGELRRNYRRISSQERQSKAIFGGRDFKLDGSQKSRGSPLVALHLKEIKIAVLIVTCGDSKDDPY